MKKKNFIINAAIYIFLIAVLIVVVVPIFYTIMSSFKTNSEIMAHPDRLFPETFMLDNYKAAWGSGSFNIPRMLWNSTYYTVLVVIITVTMSSLMGYVFARGGNFPGSKIVFAVFSSLMFINFGSITIYAVFKVLGIIHLDGSLWGLIVMKFFSVGIANVYIVRGYITSLPKEMDEAAEIDGCSFIGIFFRIIAPLLKPVIATLVVLAFNASWNDYLMPTLFTITNPQQRPLIVGIMQLKNSGAAASSWNLMLAGATVALIPVLIVYAFCNKYFVSGIAAGAVKG